MSAIDIEKHRRREPGRRTAKATLYPRSETWEETWNELKERGYDPQSLFKEELEKAEAIVRETLLKD